MSELGQNLKNIVMKGIEAIGNTAGSIASSTKQKVNEFNLGNEQKELFSEIGRKVYQMAQEGVAFPEGIAEDLKKAAELEEALQEIRKARAEEEKEKTETEEQPAASGQTEETREAEIPEAAEYAAQDDLDVPVIRVEDAGDEEGPEPCPLSSAINDLFEKMPPVDKMMDKVNSSLDDLGENLRKFSGEFDKQLNEFAEQMMKNDPNGKDE